MVDMVDHETELAATSVPGTPLEKFNRGLLNSNNTILSNMIAEKTNMDEESLLSKLLMNQSTMLEILMMLVKSLLEKFVKKGEVK
jgi:hypothetical protein